MPGTRFCRSTRSCCLLALDRHAGLRRLIPHGQLAGELRSIARDDERARRDERRLLNRLRADLIAAALTEDQFIAPPHLVRAKVDTIRLLARQLLLIDAQRRAWEKRMGELLLGTLGQPAEDQPGPAFPGGEIYLSFPGLGRRLAARITGEIGEHIEQFTFAAVTDHDNLGLSPT